MRQAWYSSMDRKPKRERKQRMSFLNRFKTNSPRITRKQSTSGDARKFEIGTPILNKGIENLKRYNCISIAHANKLQNNDSGYQDQEHFGTFPRRRKNQEPAQPEFENHSFRGLRYLTTQAEKLLTCDGESLYEEVLTYDSINLSASSKVDEEEISSQFDHCESLLSDLEFIGTGYTQVFRLFLVRIVFRNVIPVCWTL